MAHSHNLLFDYDSFQHIHYSDSGHILSNFYNCTSSGGASPDPWRARGARAYSGIWGQSPQRGPGAEPLVGGQGGRSPPEAESFLAFGRPSDKANLHPCRNFAKSENHMYCLSYSLHTHGTPASLFFFNPVGVPQHLFPSLREPCNIILFLFCIYHYWWIKIFISFSRESRHPNPRAGLYCRSTGLWCNQAPNHTRIYSMAGQSVKSVTRGYRSGRTTTFRRQKGRKVRLVSQVKKYSSMQWN